MSNLLLSLDSYKHLHHEQYPPKTTKVYSYLESRGTRIPEIDYTVFFGLQYYLKKYFGPVTKDNVEEFLDISRSINGPAIDRNCQKFYDLAKLGYLPLEIKAVSEGTTIRPLGNVLVTITNTHPDYFWLVNAIETNLMKLWSPITVASNSLRFRLLFEKYSAETCDNNDHVKFQIHDFGGRGVSSEETAMIAGASHLTSFLGSDTVQAVYMLKKYYNAQNPIGLSVPASEHSVMCSWSEDNDDRPAIKNMLDLYPNGIVSIVSDSYDLWKTITDYYGGEFKEQILARDGKVVIRPDSGDPVLIVCGNPDAPVNTPEYLGVIRLLNRHFGSTTNNAGYRVLNPKIGCIYGDGIFYERANTILSNLKDMGYASSNIVFGSGGLLLNNWSRDTLKMAIKATYCEVDGKSRPIEKNPITDKHKKSKKGLLSLIKDDQFNYHTEDQCSEESGELQTVFKDGNITETSLEDVRQRIDTYVGQHLNKEIFLPV